jgi:hypothetical protein
MMKWNQKNSILLLAEEPGVPPGGKTCTNAKTA